MSRQSVNKLNQAIVMFRENPNVFSREALDAAAREHMRDFFLREQREVLEGRIILNDEEDA